MSLLWTKRKNFCRRNRHSFVSSVGEPVTEFEKNLFYTGIKYAVAVVNGTCTTPALKVSNVEENLK